MAKLKEGLEDEKTKAKEMWRLSCVQLSQFDSALAEKDDEIAHLKERLARVDQSSSRMFPVASELGGDDDLIPPVRRLPQRRSGEPP